MLNTHSEIQLYGDWIKNNVLNTRTTKNDQIVRRCEAVEHDLAMKRQP